MLKLKVYYQEDKELEKLKRVLGANIVKIKIPKKQQNNIKKAFISFK